MTFPSIKYCPGTLAAGYDSYSRACLKRLFDGRKVSHVLPYFSLESEEYEEKVIENRKNISISGVQEKLSLRLDKNQLRLTEPGEQGHYILKPFPRDFKNARQIPANEHLTMQIARQVYRINTAENILIFFGNGDPAYLTRRFDLKPDHTKHLQEDFASLAGKTRHTDGDGFKYEGSYEEMAAILQAVVPAYRVEIEKFFALVLFNYLFSNGDAHLKNFSLLDTPFGDYILSPAYDLICTRLHVHDTYFALQDGLFSDDFETEGFQINGFYSYDDFLEFALRIGLSDKRAKLLLDRFRKHYTETEDLISRSFLNEANKALFRQYYQDRLKMLNYSFSKKIPPQRF